jgi:hypothetical protein
MVQGVGGGSARVQQGRCMCRRGWCKGSAGIVHGVSRVGARGRRGWCKGWLGVEQGVSMVVQGVGGGGGGARGWRG